MKNKLFCAMFMRNKREYQTAVWLLSFCFTSTIIVYNGILVTDVQFLHYHGSNSKLSTVYFIKAFSIFQVEYSIIGQIPQNKLDLYIGFGGNITAKFIDYQILANTLILILKQNGIIILPIDILLMVMKSAIDQFV